MMRVSPFPTNILNVDITNCDGCGIILDWADKEKDIQYSTLLYRQKQGEKTQPWRTGVKCSRKF